MSLRFRPGMLLAVWLGCWLVAFTLTHIPIQRGISSPILHLDKVAHIMLYFLVAYLGGLRLTLRPQPAALRVLMLWALVYLVYGALDELTQPLTGREADVADWVFDAIGVGLATLSLWLGFIPKWVHRSRTGN